MRFFKKWYKLLILITQFFITFSSVQADENVVGFQIGTNNITPSESRFKGSGTHFALVFPVDNGISAVYYQESDFLTGEAIDTTIGTVYKQLNISINELRIQKEIGSSVLNIPLFEIFLGMGTASITNAFNSNRPIADIGIKMIPLRTKKKVTELSLSIDAVYRYLKIDKQQPFGSKVAKPDIDNLGGLVIGLDISMLF